MRAAAAIGAISLLLFSSSIAFTRQQQDATAEQAFKNIQSFKGKKASDVIPAMQFMSGSLKVNCEYCHTADYASDDKQEKGAAREMIAMQNDINQRHFNGRNQVTCATCHAGRTHPLAFPPAEGADTRVRRSQGLTADQIIATFAKAVGQEASKPMPAMVWEGIDLSHGEKVKTDTMFVSGKFVMTNHTSKGDVKMGWNGGTMWYANGPMKRVLPSDIGVQFVNQEMLFTSPETLPKFTNPSAGTAKIGARDMVVLSGTLPGGNVRASIFFDKKTGLPARTTYLYPTILGSMPEINDFSDYRKIDGFQLPMTIANHKGEDDTVKHFTAVKMNAKIDATVFDPPK